MSLDPNVQWHYPVNDEDEEGSTETDTDDYCSSASDLSDNTYMLLQQSFAIHRRRRHFNEKEKESPEGKDPGATKGKVTIRSTTGEITARRYPKDGRRRNGWHVPLVKVAAADGTGTVGERRKDKRREGKARREVPTLFSC